MPEKYLFISEDATDRPRVRQRTERSPRGSLGGMSRREWREEVKEELVEAVASQPRIEKARLSLLPFFFFLSFDSWWWTKLAGGPTTAALKLTKVTIHSSSVLPRLAASRQGTGRRKQEQLSHGASCPPRWGLFLIMQCTNVSPEVLRYKSPKSRCRWEETELIQCNPLLSKIGWGLA